MEHTPFPHEQARPTDSRRWAFLKRRRNKETAPPVLPEQTPVPPARKFARNILGLLGVERARPTPPVETIQPEVTVSRARKWGRRVLDFVGRTQERVEAGPEGPVRTENRRVIREAKTDMQDAQQDLETAATQKPVPGESHFAGLDFARDIKQEAKRTVRSLRAERQRLKEAQPPSETANAVTLGILAMIGGGLFMSVVDQRQARAERKKIEKQEKVLQKHEERIETLEVQLEAVKAPDRELVRRIGEFTHKQAALTREVAQEVREHHTQTAEVPTFFAEPRVQERKATFIIPEIHTPEAAHNQSKLDQPNSAMAAGGAGQGAHQQTPITAPTKNNQPKKPATKSKKKKVPPKDPVAGYVAAAVATAVAVALWFALAR